MRSVFIAGVLSLSLSQPEAQSPAATCASLAARTLPNTTIATAQEVTNGSFTPPAANNILQNLPPFCRVTGVIAPTAESEIRFELWMPLGNWNGKFAGVGKGGGGGDTSSWALAA